MKPSFLLDTNVIIQFEEVGTDRRIKTAFQQLHSLLVEHSLLFRFHPMTENDLENDPDKSRLEEMRSRLKKYPALDNPPLAEGVELEKLFGGIAKTNDLIDCQILYSLKRNCTTYLVSEDVRLHKRVANTEMDERVLFVREAIDLITRKYRPENVKLPNINHEHLYNLDLNDSFFNSLKADYANNKGGFETWVKEKATRNCWTIRIEKELAGLCIYKHDDAEEHKGINMPSMKLSTFKVSDNFEGQKFGELLLKMALNHAVKNKMASIWITADQKQTKLLQFLKKFGFLVHADLKGQDMIFYKLMYPPANLPEMEPLEFHKLFSPHFYDHERIKKFAIPIQPEFHDVLFPEVSPQLTLLSNSIPGNTIRKVYLCHAVIKELPPGSIIYFYRSSPEQYIQTVGVVERSRRLNDTESLAAAIGKRSVYTTEQVEEMIKKEVLVIDFRLVEHIKEPIHLRSLLTENTFKGPPQSISEIEHSKYLLLKKSWIKNNS